ncbi:hypothetical protein LTR56_003611 [Elasticomyces elasticus]|nr:hypothetical protein LTR56_003611 [Elasticomyces elasticus]KAK3663744.1 hypothetical protein LTR22_005445 [Elasticomyces elasticus]KAK4927262.1 hypothetical protein LTR49_005927 [Elasticomyces elasticus]KAK5767332.1 hypothetical protein LTS12_002485 [Elasticomyces elasticus]
MTDQASKQHEKNGKDEPDEWLFADLDMDGVTGWIVHTDKDSENIEKLSATFTLDLNYDEQDKDGNNTFGFDAIRLFGTEDASVEGVADTFPGLSTFCVHLHFALDNLDEVPKAPSEQSVDTGDIKRFIVGKLQDAVDILEWDRCVDLYFVLTDARHSQVRPEKDLYNGNKIKKTDLATLLLANLSVPVFVGTLAAVGSATGGSSVFID